MIDDPEKIANASLHQRTALMDEIERLQEALATCRALRALDTKEIERLREALKEIAGLEYDHVAMVDIARIALDGKP